MNKPFFAEVDEASSILKVMIVDGLSGRKDNRTPYEREEDMAAANSSYMSMRRNSREDALRKQRRAIKSVNESTKSREPLIHSGGLAPGVLSYVNEDVTGEIRDIYYRSGNKDLIRVHDQTDIDTEDAKGAASQLQIRQGVVTNIPKHR